MLDNSTLIVAESCGKKLTASRSKWGPGELKHSLNSHACSCVSITLPASS